MFKQQSRFFSKNDSVNRKRKLRYFFVPTFANIWTNPYRDTYFKIFWNYAILFLRVQNRSVLPETSYFCKHFCMPSPLAPYPIRVQSCGVYSEPIEIVYGGSIYLSIYLIIQLEILILQSALSVNGNIFFCWNYSGKPNS